MTNKQIGELLELLRIAGRSEEIFTLAEREHIYQAFLAVESASHYPSWLG